MNSKFLVVMHNVELEFGIVIVGDSYLKKFHRIYQIKEMFFLLFFFFKFKREKGVLLQIKKSSLLIDYQTLKEQD